MKFKETLPGVKLGIVALLVAIGGGFNFGFQFVIINPSQSAFINFLNASLRDHYGLALSPVELENIWSVIAAILYFGAIFGSMNIRFVAERFGRLHGLLAAFTLSTVAVLLSVLSYFVNSIELYAISRFILGYTFGLTMGLSGIYLTESSPKRCRGFVSMTIGVFIQIGTVAGSALSMPNLLGTNERWWLIYGIESIVLIAVTVPLLFVHDSPTYLYHKGDVSGCRAALAFFHACDPAGIDAEYNEMRSHIDKEVKTVGMFKIFSDKAALRGTLVGSVITVAMTFTGIPVVGAFSVNILTNCGLDLLAASYGNLLLTVICTISHVGATFIIEHFGRRSLLLFSITSIIATNLTIFALMLAFERLQYPWIGFLLVAAIALFLVFLATGAGPLCYFVTAELVGQRERSAAQSWNTLVQMISRSLILALFLPLKNALGGSFAYLTMFVAPLVFAVLVLYFYLPETKNRNLKEVQGAIHKLPKLNCLRRIK